MAESRDHILERRHNIRPVKEAVRGRSVQDSSQDTAEGRGEILIPDPPLQMPRHRGRRSDRGDDRRMGVCKSRGDSVRGQSSRPAPSLMSMSRTELKQYRVDVLLHLMDKLNTVEYRGEFREALRRSVSGSVRRPKQSMWQRYFKTRAESSPKRDVHALAKKIAKNMKNIKLGYDSWGLIETAFLALICDDELKKPSFDLINVYNAESASMPSRFYFDREYLGQLTKMSWVNYVLDVVISTSSHYLNEYKYLADANGTKFALATFCEVLSKRVRKPRRGLKKLTIHADDVFQMGRGLAYHKKCIHAVFAFYTASKLYKREQCSDSSAGITTCSYEILLAVEQMKYQRGIVVVHVIWLLERMLRYVEYLTSEEYFSTGQYDADEHRAKCRSFIGVCCYTVGEYELGLKQFEHAIELMDRKDEVKLLKKSRISIIIAREESEESGETASEESEETRRKYKAYGDCLCFEALSYYKMGNIGKAYAIFCGVLKAYNVAVDWGTSEEEDGEVHTAIKRVKSCLEKLG